LKVRIAPMAVVQALAFRPRKADIQLHRLRLQFARRRDINSEEATRSFTALAKFRAASIC
jgi:hypothetical protein